MTTSEEFMFIEKWKENKDDCQSFLLNFSLEKVSNVQESRENTMNSHNKQLF